MILNSQDFRFLGDRINTNHINWLNKHLSDQHDYDPFWADEPNWTKFHAASWNALRNDSWTNMGFSPKSLSQNNGILGESISSESDFVKTVSAYSALIDILTLGGHWRNPMQTFDYMHVLPLDELGFTQKFMKFWRPMLNQLGAWMYRSDALNYSHPFENFRIIRPGDLMDSHTRDDISGVDYEQKDTKWNLPSDEVGGFDMLHLSRHSLKPLQIDHEELKLPGNYYTLDSPSYSGWAYRLLDNLYRPVPTLVRVDVGVHRSMEGKSTLGHFLVSDGRTPRKDGNDFPVEIRYVNDLEALRMISDGVITNPMR
jgi:hypothetical protein